MSGEAQGHEHPPHTHTQTPSCSCSGPLRPGKRAESGVHGELGSSSDQTGATGFP